MTNEALGRIAALLTLAVTATGCGAAEPSDGAGVTTTTTTAATTSAHAPATIDRIDDAATATTPADRLDEAVRVTWIGGSEIDLDDRSLPNAVTSRNPMVGDRPVHLFADTKIAPLPHEVAARVERAAALNTDALVVILNPSWLSWDGHTECSGIAQPHEFYACVLTPRPDTDVTALRDDVADLVDTIVATGIPAYVYVIPHSAESLANPTLDPLLVTAEARFAELDPHLARIRYVGHLLSRDLPPLREGIEFNDMVHPSDAGIEVLAEWFTAELTQFLAESIPEPG